MTGSIYWSIRVADFELDLTDCASGGWKIIVIPTPQPAVARESHFRKCSIARGWMGPGPAASAELFNATCHSNSSAFNSCNHTCFSR